MGMRHLCCGLLLVVGCLPPPPPPTYGPAQPQPEAQTTPVDPYAEPAPDAWGAATAGPAARKRRGAAEAAPRHPIAKMPYVTRAKRLFERSRKVAKSGINPMYQNKSETVK